MFITIVFIDLLSIMFIVNHANKFTSKSLFHKEHPE